MRGGDFEVLEGEDRPRRLIVMEFPEMAALNGWYDSAEYADLRAMRRNSSRSNLVAVEGV